MNEVMSRQCPFCKIIESDSTNRIIDQNDLGFVIYDSYPINEGHTLIIPKRHISSFFEITHEERNALLSLLDSAKTILNNEFKPNSYNIGINDGKAAGQTVPHLHIHLIPRYQGDMEDARGGVRWIFPDKAKYW